MCVETALLWDADKLDSNEGYWGENWENSLFLPLNLAVPRVLYSCVNIGMSRVRVAESTRRTQSVLSPLQTANKRWCCFFASSFVRWNPLIYPVPDQSFGFSRHFKKIHNWYLVVSSWLRKSVGIIKLSPCLSRLGKIKFTWLTWLMLQL